MTTLHRDDGYRSDGMVYEFCDVCHTYGPRHDHTGLFSGVSAITGVTALSEFGWGIAAKPSVHPMCQKMGEASDAPDAPSGAQSADGWSYARYGDFVVAAHPGHEPTMTYWGDPTPEMLASDPLFDAIWRVIKSWDVNVPSVYSGYCGATGNHARVIYDEIVGQVPSDFWRKVIDRSQPTRSADMPVQPNPSAPSEVANAVHRAVMQHRT